MSTKPIPIFGMVAIADKRCSSRGCDGEPVAVMPWRTREEGTTVVWACAEHAQALREEGVPAYEITATCGMGDDTPCGAAATHVAVVGVRGGGLGVVSVCRRHATDEGGGA
jgi:hypothetical protein